MNIFSRPLPGAFASIVISIFFTVSTTVFSATPAVSDQPRAPNSITLEQALELALLRNPQIKARQSGVTAAASREVQAGLLPNPEVEAEFEDYGLNGEARGNDEAKFAVRVAQDIELGGKRRKRSQVARLETQLAEWDLRIAHLDLRGEVQRRFIALLAAQERLTRIQGGYEVARGIRKVAAERVESGKVSPLELVKADVGMASAEVELKRAERELVIARSGLIALWNASPDELGTLQASGDLHELPTVPDFNQLQARLAQNPDLAKGQAEEERAWAQVTSEKAGRIPDVTVMAGITQEYAQRNETAQIAVSIPLPLFDRNQGNIGAALAEAEAAREEQLATKIKLQTELTGRWQKLMGAYDEVNAVKNNVLPAARQAFAATEEAYRRGKTEYLDVLDARKTLADMELQLIEALTRLHFLSADMQRLAGSE